MRNYLCKCSFKKKLFKYLGKENKLNNINKTFYLKKKKFHFFIINHLEKSFKLIGIKSKYFKRNNDFIQPKIKKTFINFEDKKSNTNDIQNLGFNKFNQMICILKDKEINSGWHITKGD